MSEERVTEALEKLRESFVDWANEIKPIGSTLTPEALQTAYEGVAEDGQGEPIQPIPLVATFHFRVTESHEEFVGWDCEEHHTVIDAMEPA